MSALRATLPRYGAAFLLALTVCAVLPTPTSAATYGTFGNRVISTSTDFNMQYAGSAALTAAKICARDTGNTGSALDDLYYIRMGASVTTVNTYDLRVT